jgi:hypothetical protein
LPVNRIPDIRSHSVQRKTIVEAFTVMFYFHTIIESEDKMKYHILSVKKGDVLAYIVKVVHTILQAIIAAGFNYLVIKYLF